ncbi:MAG: acetyl-CoA hydrolase/transferase C-terminal domain-containing protein [Bacteriovoracaceae bacterium]
MGFYNNKTQCVDEAIQYLGKEITLGCPLGAGKPNHLINEFYKRAKNDPSIKLTILTALSLNKPTGPTDLEKRFFGPFSERVLGNYPDLEFEADREKNTIPSNIQVIEFYYPAGKKAKNEYAQRNYLSSNFTHVPRDVLDRGINLVVQQVAKREKEGKAEYSLSCNADTSLDILDLLKKSGKKWLSIAQVNEDLPFMLGDALIKENTFHYLIDDPKDYFPIFAPPKLPVTETDYMIGLYASSLIKDDGELQVGIGSLGDALIYNLGLRNKKNDVYLELLEELEVEKKFSSLIDQIGGREVFKKGLFCATEMMVDGIMDLYKNDILKKKVYDHVGLQRLINQGVFEKGIPDNILEILVRKEIIQNPLTQNCFQFLKKFGIVKEEIKFERESLILKDHREFKADINDERFFDNMNLFIGDGLKSGQIVHGGFFLGPRSFYNWLKSLSEQELELFNMKSISKINQLYGHEEIDRLHRKNARFVNTCLKISMNGQFAADGLEDGTVVSGVGGQYNFVSMAHALPDGRSILICKSSHGEISNIVWNYGHCTIPRHLRDIVITEYGMVCLRGKTDEELIKELLKITDSRHQEALIEQAKKYGKLDKSYSLPSEFSNNFPHVISSKVARFKSNGLFPLFPFGTDFTPEELKIAKGLKKIKALKSKKTKFLALVLKSLFYGSNPKEKFNPLLARMAYGKTKLNFSQRLQRNLLLNVLE